MSASHLPVHAEDQGSTPWPGDLVLPPFEAAAALGGKVFWCEEREGEGVKCFVAARDRTEYVVGSSDAPIVLLGSYHTCTIHPRPSAATSIHPRHPPVE